MISIATTAFGSEHPFLSQRKRQDFMVQKKAEGCHLSKEQRNFLWATAYLSLEDNTVNQSEIQSLRQSRSVALRSDGSPCINLIVEIDKLKAQRSYEKTMMNSPEA